ncbi:MAG: transketolase [Bifidobacteriaceae bacterium]|nr:transketolase [Bifidobacteriaceae bacterium]
MPQDTGPATEPGTEPATEPGTPADAPKSVPVGTASGTGLGKREWLRLEAKADQLRRLTLDTTYWAGAGHIGGGMSVLDILTVIYHKHLNYKLDDPVWPDRDRVILSKGHAGIAYAPLLCDLGWNDPALLKTFNLTNSPMGMHLDAAKVVGVDASTGSLGHGLPIAAGTALAARVQGKDWWVYCVTGDGELNEGSCWEAFMAIAHYQLDHVITIVDRNKFMIDGATEEVMALGALADKLRAFGLNVIEAPGHSLPDLSAAIDAAKSHAGQPTAIIADTVKGAGIDFMEGDYVWHYGALDEAMHKRAQASLERYYGARRARAEAEGV